MNRWCKLLGHAPEHGYLGNPAYGKVHAWTVDGTGREHCCVEVPCRRCGTPVEVVRFHRKPELPPSIRRKLEAAATVGGEARVELTGHEAALIRRGMPR